MLTVDTVTPWAPMVVRLAVAVLRGNGDVLILVSKTPQEYFLIDIMDELGAKGLGHGELAEPEPAESEHGLAAMPSVCPPVCGE